jgi:enamine deaminase RidA (YjgF/YER057c/UK114 family)
MRTVEPEGWPRPRGYSNGMLAEPGGALLFVAGQIGWDEQERLVPGGLVAQFEQALANVVAVVFAGGGAPEHIARLTIYVTDKQAYRMAAKDVGAVYRRILGRHYPAMALVQVADLLEDGALVEIEATAVIPGPPPRVVATRAP